MKLISIVAAIAGVAVAALLVTWFGVGAVLHAIREVGIVGFAAICALHLGLIIPLGAAWKALLPDVADRGRYGHDWFAIRWRKRCRYRRSAAMWSAPAPCR